MKTNLAMIAAVSLLAISFGTAPVSAGLLGNLGKAVDKTVDKVVDTVDKTVDKVKETTGTGDVVDKVISINDPNDALVNVDTDNGTVVTTAIGSGDSPLVEARVGGLSSKNVVTIDLGGLDLDLVIDIGTPDPNNPNAPNNPGGGPILVGSLGGGSGGTFVITCAVENTKTLLQVAANGKLTASEIRAWQRAANVQVIPIELCPNAKAQIAKLLVKSKKIMLLRRAVTMDNLIMASLSRTKYDANDVVAVQRRSGQLVVYVY